MLGHEGEGVSTALQARCSLSLRIPQPGGEESLNVGAAADFGGVFGRQAVDVIRIDAGLFERSRRKRR